MKQRGSWGHCFLARRGRGLDVEYMFFCKKRWPQCEVCNSSYLLFINLGRVLWTILVGHFSCTENQIVKDISRDAISLCKENQLISCYHIRMIHMWCHANFHGFQLGDLPKSLQFISWHECFSTFSFLLFLSFLLGLNSRNVVPLRPTTPTGEHWKVWSVEAINWKYVVGRLPTFLLKWALFFGDMLIFRGCRSCEAIISQRSCDVGLFTNFSVVKKHYHSFGGIAEWLW